MCISSNVPPVATIRNFSANTGSRELCVVQYSFAVACLTLIEYLDCLRWTDVFTCHTEYTVLFSYHEGLFVRCWVAGRFKPFVDIDRACFNTCAVCNANVKVYAYFLTPYT